MQTICFLAVIVLALNYVNAKKCETWSSSSFNCGGKGKLEIQELQDGGCKYACVDGDVIKYCEDLYPAPNSPKYEHASCKGRVATYECINDTEPEFVDLGETCHFHCRRSDMLFLCEILHPTDDDK